MNEKEDDIFHIDVEKYYGLKDKILKMVDDKYLKSFRKELKIFQIITVGYNASQQKDLQVFKKYGWNVHLLCDTENIMSVCTFERQILPNMKCWIRIAKNDETGVLKSEKLHNEYITISVSDEHDDELCNLIKQFIDMIDGDIFGNNFLKLCIRHQPDSRWYHLDIICKI